MRIGITRSLADSASGGVFQYEIVFLKALSEIAARLPGRLAYMSYNPTDLGLLADVGGLSYRGIPVLPLSKTSVYEHRRPEDYLLQRPPTPLPVDPSVVEFDYLVGGAFREKGIDFILALSPSIQAFTFRLPFVIPIFDLNHRLQPEFPEVSAFGEANRREHYYINTCKFATLVVVDSEIGKADVLRFYQNVIDEDRIRILPYYPPLQGRELPNAQEVARVRAKYNLPPRYFFYPAQFWPHKNHVLILQAIKRIADETGEVVPVIFCGAYWHYIMAHNFKDVMALALKLGIADRVRYLGSVPDQDMAALYALSAGLVMPTFFGPTNIPPLEAWHFGCPVITSDIRGAREQSGDASLLIDPRSPEALAQAMQRIWRDDALCAQLVARGKQRLASYSWSSFVDKIESILTEAGERVASGRTPLYPEPQTVNRTQRA